ncbi:MAG: mRNA-degrading endonuclease toxin of MazEF toxin-antitoxin module [Cyanobium sp.]|jgi:mRNA-degrading endonuclease toxin of MazEF toxin-antitoxin module
MPSPGDLGTWPCNPLLRDSKRRPVVVLSPAYPGRSTVLVVPLSSDLSSRSLPLRVVIKATPANGLEIDSLALCDQLTCLLAQLRQRGALALGLMPSDLRPVGGSYPCPLP